VKIGEKIRKIRKSKNVSLGILEKYTGISKGNLSLIEHGKVNPRISTLEKIAKALKVPLWTFFTDEQMIPEAKAYSANTVLQLSQNEIKKLYENKAIYVKFEIQNKKKKEEKK